MSQINFPLERIRYREPGAGDFIIVGQQPSGNDPENPLATDNAAWSGARLARMATISGEDFERHFARVNVNYLGEDKFRVNELTRAKARDINSTFRPNDHVILLGAAVLKCFSGLVPRKLFENPFEVSRNIHGTGIAVIPHPSGLNRWYNDPSNIVAVGRFLKECYEGKWPLSVES